MKVLRIQRHCHRWDISARLSFPPKDHDWNPSAKNQICIEHNFADAVYHANPDLGYRPVSSGGTASRIHATTRHASVPSQKRLCILAEHVGWYCLLGCFKPDFTDVTDFPQANMARVSSTCDISCALRREKSIAARVSRRAYAASCITSHRYSRLGSSVCSISVSLGVVPSFSAVAGCPLDLGRELVKLVSAIR